MKLISGEFGKECIKLVEPARVLVTLHLYIYNMYRQQNSHRADVYKMLL